MTNDFLRMRIALLFLSVMGALGACSTSSDCDAMAHTTEHDITREQALALMAPDGGASRTCDDVCNEADPGPTLSDVRSCEVTAVDGGIVLVCHHARLCR